MHSIGHPKDLIRLLSALFGQTVRCRLFGMRCPIPDDREDDGERGGLIVERICHMYNDSTVWVVGFKGG